MEVMNNAYKNDRMHVHEVGMKKFNAQCILMCVYAYGHA
jgi:hypothetical protein